MALSRIKTWGAEVLHFTDLNAEFDNLLTPINALTPTGYGTGDLLYAISGSQWAALANVATGNALLSGGVGAAPAYGKVGLTTHVSGILPTANGGTGIAYFTAAGPTVARVYTFPDAAATMLYSGGALGTPSSGVATNLTGLPAASVLAGTFGTGAYTMDTSLTISSTAPSLVLTDTTASAKSLTVAVDANLAQLRESAGASGSLMVLDLVNNRLALGASVPEAQLDIRYPVAKTDTTIRLVSALASNETTGFSRLAAFFTGGASQAVRVWTLQTTEAGVSDGGSISLQAFGGSVGIGKTPTQQFELSGSVGQKASGTTWSNPSDARLKDDVRDYTDGLDVLRKIRPVRYTLNGLAGTPKGTKGISIIAQEMLEVMPYTIETYKAKLHPEDTDDTELYRFEASALTFALVNAVKELAARIEMLERRN